MELSRTTGDLETRATSELDPCSTPTSRMLVDAMETLERVGCRDLLMGEWWMLVQDGAGPAGWQPGLDTSIIVVQNHDG